MIKGYYCAGRGLQYIRSWLDPSPIGSIIEQSARPVAMALKRKNFPESI